MGSQRHTPQGQETQVVNELLLIKVNVAFVGGYTLVVNGVGTVGMETPMGQILI